MTQEEIVIGNVLIAEFMGGEKDRDERNHYRFQRPFLIWVPKGENYHEKIVTLYSVHKTKLKYHLSFDWIMEVVQEIYFESDDNTREFKGLSIFEYGIATPIEDVWKSVIEFIKYYNTQKTLTP